MWAFGVVATLSILTADEGVGVDARRYRQHFELRFDDHQHAFEPLEVQGLRLMSQRFTPKGDSIGVVHILHGYLDHAAIQAPLIERLTQAGYTVRTLDLPGHGLSGGSRAAIEHMDDYVVALEAWLKGQQRPLRMVAHSMGCAVLMEVMRRRVIDSKARVVLLAPLVRWRAWRLSAVGEALIGWAVRSIPRSKRRTSGDEAFQALRQNDPLRPERIPIKWVRALRRWAKTFELTPALPHRPMILQGRRDRVVDWRHNHRIIQKIFPSASFHFFAQGRHHLQGEEPTLRSRVFAMIEEQLGGD